MQLNTHINNKLAKQCATKVQNTYIHLVLIAVFKANLGYPVDLMVIILHLFCNRTMMPISNGIFTGQMPLSERVEK